MGGGRAEGNAHVDSIGGALAGLPKRFGVLLLVSLSCSLKRSARAVQAQCNYLGV